MDGNIPYMFYCWADPGVHLLLLKSSMDYAMGPNLTVGWFNADCRDRKFSALSTVESAERCI